MQFFEESNYKSKAYGILKNQKMLSQNRILISDDENFCLDAMKIVLELSGMRNLETQLDCCINGQDQLNQIIESYKLGMSYKFIFTDFNMPIMNGIESTRLIR